MNPLLFKHDPSKDIEDVIPVKSFAKVTAIKEVISEINSGQVALFMNGKPEAFIINAIDFQKREIGKAENEDRKSTRLNSSHVAISYAVFCLKKKNQHYNK